MKSINKSTQKLSTSFTAALIVALLLCGAALAQSTAQEGTVNRPSNLRAGPGTNFAILDVAQTGQSVTVVDENASGTWYELEDGEWIAAFLVDIDSDAPSVAAPTAAAAATSGVASTSGVANRGANLRAGPGVNFDVIGGVRVGQALEIVDRNAAGTWFELANGAWIAAFLVDEDASEAVAAAPTRAPAATPAPTSTPAPTDAPAPTAAPTDAPAPASGRFVVVEKRLWDPIENGGTMDGPSVHCGQGRRLVVRVQNADGSPLNNAAVQVLYGAKEIYVTGSQGKGDGVTEFILGGGQDAEVIRVNGQPVESEIARGMSTNPHNIPRETLQSAGYCQDENTCRSFVENNGCFGHFSWTVTFRQQN